MFASGRDVKALPMADSTLIPHEIKASKAWVKMLCDVGLIDKIEKDKLVDGLNSLMDQYNKGEFELDPMLEDVQTNIEVFLIELLGEDIGGKIHTGRSRNEQAVVEMILYLKDFNQEFIEKIKGLVDSLENSSNKFKDCVIPGYTHYQQAKLTTLGKIFECYANEFSKDIKRFLCWEIEEISPLGSAAGYGSSLPVDKHKVNEYLGLKYVFENEIQAITFKGDAECQMVFNLAMFMNHVSSLAQTLIVFSTKEFGIVELSEEYLTGSSIMPQKKNPDVLEVMKAKASMCHGYLMSLFSLGKAGFVGYNRDLQYTKYCVMDALQEVEDVPGILAGVVSTLEYKGCELEGFIFAQNIMEGLIKDYGVPMRKAKQIVETVVKESEEEIKYEDLKKEVDISESLFKKWVSI